MLRLWSFIDKVRAKSLARAARRVLKELGWDDPLFDPGWDENELTVRIAEAMNDDLPEEIPDGTHVVYDQRLDRFEAAATQAGRGHLHSFALGYQAGFYRALKVLRVPKISAFVMLGPSADNRAARVDDPKTLTDDPEAQSGRRAS